MKQLLFFLSSGFIMFQLSAQDLKGKIVYSHHNSFVTDSPDSIYAIGNNGQNQFFITLGYRPRVSHNENYLAFSNGPNPNSSFQANLWIRNLVTQQDTLIVPNSDSLDYYDFSPNDSQLVYARNCSIYSTNIDGTNSDHFLTDTPGCFSDDPSVRLQDSMIVFHNVNHGIYTMNFDGSNPQIFPNTLPGDLYPTWSPDAAGIAFYRQTPGGAPYQENNIYKIKNNGSTLSQLTFFSSTDTLAPGPVWAKDLVSIYFIGRIKDTLGVYKVRTDGSGSYERFFTFPPDGSVSDYWLGRSDSINSTLPVTLLNFNGVYEGKSVRLSWQTTQEINSSYFEIQRSLNGSTFSKTGIVTANGNSNLVSNYVFVDNNLPIVNNQQPAIFYRLKSVDKDGNYAYSNIITLNIYNIGNFGVFPNPSKGSFRLVTKELNKKLDVLITDASGKQVYHHTFYNTSSEFVQLPAIKGIYLITVKDDKNSMKKKLVIQ